MAQAILPAHRRIACATPIVTDFIPAMCPYCGEMVELDVQDDGWSRQSYVQDCPVCCQPWQVEVIRDRDGDWNATLRTTDE